MIRLEDSRLHMHPLVRSRREDPYRCDGCNEYGCGERYECTQRGCPNPKRYHSFCARPAREINHPFLTGCAFQFRDRGNPWYQMSTLGRGERRCDACGQLIDGFFYRCSSSVPKRSLHPWCANLKPSFPVTMEGKEITVYLRKRLTQNCMNCNMNTITVHRWCDERGRKEVAQIDTWAYATRNNEYNFHIHCTKELMVRAWEGRLFIRNSGNNAGNRLTIGESNTALTNVYNPGNTSMGQMVVYRQQRDRPWIGVAAKVVRAARIVGTLAMSVFGVLDVATLSLTIQNILTSR